jgi:hypothetical protein
MGIAHLLEHPAAVRLYALADKAAMTEARLRHLIAVGVPQPNAIRDIGEQQRHRAPAENPHLRIVAPAAHAGKARFGRC